MWLYESICTDGCPAFGACCLDDGTCDDLTAEQCANADGIYEGDGTDCATANCPPAGACCLHDGSCLQRTETACAAEEGIYHGDGTDCATTACPYGSYSNEVDEIEYFRPSSTATALGDDLTLVGDLRDLGSLNLAVFAHSGGAFDVTVSLYTDCPGDGGTLIPDTTFSWYGVADDSSVYELAVDPIDPPVTIPDTVWMVATFSTPQSGWIIAEEAETGFTEDRYGWSDPWNCNATDFGCCYHGLWANLRCVEGGSRASGDDQATRLSITKVETDATPVAIEAAE